jgi:hypothetical protein
VCVFLCFYATIWGVEYTTEDMLLGKLTKAVVAVTSLCAAVTPMKHRNRASTV